MRIDIEVVNVQNIYTMQKCNIIFLIVIKMSASEQDIIKE